MTQNLNNLNSFTSEGFKIERNGEIFTLTSQEMRIFRELDSALDGRNSLEWYLDIIEENEQEKIEIINEMMEDLNDCYQINQDFLDVVLSEAGEDEMYVIERQIKRKLSKKAKAEDK